MIKNNEMKQILENWRNFNQSDNTSVLSERVFYGSDKNYVTSKSDYNLHFSKEPILIYDDYRKLIGKTVIGGAGLYVRCISKKYAKQDEDAIKTLMYDILEATFGEREITQEDLDKIDERIEVYKEKWGHDLFTNDTLVILNPYSSFLLDDVSISQQPRVSSEYHDQNVDFDIPAGELAGDAGTFNLRKSDYPETWSDDGDEEYNKEKEYEYSSMKHNVNWSIHDLGHTIFESAYNKDNVEIDFYTGDEIDNCEAWQNIYGDLDFQGERKLDRISKEIGIDENAVLDVTALVNMLTPGVDPNDTEYSFFAKLMKDLTSDNYHKITDEIVKYCIDNIGNINQEIIDYFNLRQDDREFREYLLDIFKIQYDIAKKFEENIKFIVIS
jgi:hypothetical protein